jgi:hypothetical protein
MDTDTTLAVGEKACGVDVLAEAAGTYVLAEAGCSDV